MNPALNYTFLGGCFSLIKATAKAKSGTSSCEIGSNHSRQYEMKKPHVLLLICVFFPLLDGPIMGLKEERL